MDINTGIMIIKIKMKKPNYYLIKAAKTFDKNFTNRVLGISIADVNEHSVIIEVKYVAFDGSAQTQIYHYSDSCRKQSL